MGNTDINDVGETSYPVVVVMELDVSLKEEGFEMFHECAVVLCIVQRPMTCLVCLVQMCKKKLVYLPLQ